MIKIYKMFPDRKIDDYQDWYHFIECGIERTKKCIEFSFNIFPYTETKDRPANFHFRWSLEINFNMGFIHNFISWQ